ncbi:synaptonemal complex protein 2 isoform X2 [Betta splendens]|uniref:Synaptonemal complex protein 2 isoform X2 n=1 Tax=Betta splendens TaxID=158456 RepID=A0A6P7N2E2_BETSP|nr:synaptonemal complex protein 2 isoform X2 [Betta splendens]
MHRKMSPTQDTQLEKVLDEALKSRDVKNLDGFLQMDICEGTPIKCSQQFLTKLDKFVKRSLDQKDYKSASLGFAILYKCGKNLQFPGNKGLSAIIAQGLIKKIIQWFEKCRQLWIQHGPHWDEALLNLSEDLFDVLMVIHEMCIEGTCQITESFLYPVGQLGVDPRIYILIRKEAIRKFNLILDKMPVELKKERKILTSQEASDIMLKLAGQILEGGDYDFQTALMEALCRMATPYKRNELADRWFSMAHVAKAFTNICDPEFETDCRKFLNLVNGMQGDRRRVYSYPCLEVYLDKHELLIPPDEKLEEFWIDFNLGSHSISFYFSLADENVQEGQWETICVNENEVKSYNITEIDNRKVFQLNLLETLAVSAVEGSTLTIHFSSSLDILQAARSVYGHSKYKGLGGKTSTSVVKTIVKILMEENSSQVVPESQVSLGESERSKAPYILPASSEQMVTPAKMKISESTTIINSSTGRSVHTASSLSSVLPTATRKKARPSLKMVRSCNRKSERCTGDLRRAAKTCSHGTTPRSTKAGVMKEQNTHMAKTPGVVLTGKGILEDSFVPDTQPRTGTNISSNWNKVSVSEMLMMPTQKIITQPRKESYSNLAQQQGFPSSAQGSLVPGSGQKHFHARLIQSLQQVLCEKSQRCALQNKTPDNGGGSKVKRSSGQFASMSCSPKEQPSDLAKGKKKGQVPLEAAAAPNKALVKASTSNAMKETIPHKGKMAETSRVLSSKEKRDAEVAGSMVKLISSHYQTNSESTAKDTAKGFQQSCVSSLDKRQGFNFSWFSAAKKHVSGTGTLMKSHDKTAANSAKQGNDIFAFNGDTPAGVKSRLNTSSVISSSDNHAALVLHRKKEQSTAKKKRNVKKHLFSDTDTDCALTDVSWLKESSRKPKPKVNKYTRRQPVKPKEVSIHTSYEIPNVPSPSPVSARGNANKRELEATERMRQQRKTVKPVTAPNGKHAGRQRPKRAAAASAKNYKEPDTDGSQSKTEKCPVPKKKSQETCLVVPGVKTTRNSSCRRLSDNQSDQKKTPGLKKPELKRKLKRSDVPAKQLVNALKDSVAANQTSVCLSSPFIENMRSAERSAPILDITCSPLLSLQGSPLPASLEPTCQNTHPPLMLLPKVRSIASSKENVEPSSLYSAYKKRSTAKTLSAQSGRSLLSLRGQIPEPSIPIGPRAEISPVQHCLSPAPQCPLSLSTQPLLTSTLLELDKPSMPSPLKSPFPKDIANNGNHSSFGVSAVSQGSLSLSSTKSLGLTKRVKDSPSFALAVSHKTEKTPSSDSELRPHMSGPSRKHHISSSSNSEEDEIEERKKNNMRGERYPRMKPRKLFKSFTEVSAESEVNPVMSTSHTVSFSRWEDDVGEGDMDMDDDLELPETAINPRNLCQRFSSELKKKFQDRFTMMEFYNKQSLKTLQQHVSSLNLQVNKHRSQRHEQLKKVLLEEIHKLEQNDTVLKEMEKDLSLYWKKQAVAFHTHREQETRRNATLRKAIQSNLCSSLEYEQKIFTSQMGLIRKDMKSIQDKLLCEMQEDELQSVKRGLHALFFPDGTRF